MSGRNYPADTQKQKFFEEFYNRERDTRIAWFLKVHGEKQDSDNTGEGVKSKQYEVFRKKIEGQRAKPTGKLPPIQKSQLPSKAKQQTADEPQDAPVVIEMRPVSKPTLSLLYDGFSKEGKGRRQYLHHRYQVDPEKKYEYPILSSWDYGWRLSDVIKKEDIRKPQHGRTRIVADTFYTRTGVPSLS